jgi:hypothetical protein
VILEQNYNNAPINQASLLDQFEGKSIGFLVRDPKGGERVVEAKVVRSGYVPGGQPLEPIIELDGKLMFELPGRPLFPTGKDDNLLLKPHLNWKIQSTEPASLQAELAYITSGFVWNANYNLILSETGNTADLSAWVSVMNSSGKQFENARIKLIAGEVHRTEKLPKAVPAMRSAGYTFQRKAEADKDYEVAEKTLGDLHLYNIGRATTLRDQETKQIELARASSVPIKRIYRFNSPVAPFGLMKPVLERDWLPENRQRGNIETLLEFTNSEASRLGLPLPEGVVRVYQKDAEQLEFVGEDRIEHTPRNETMRIKLGAAFDLSGTRKRTTFNVDKDKHTLKESFEVRLGNHSTKPMEIRVVERLSRAANWTITEKTHEFRQVDSETIEFTVPVSPERETLIQYTAQYSW